MSSRPSNGEVGATTEDAAGSTPGSEKSEDGLMGSTTITTELMPAKDGEVQTKSMTYTHKGIKGISHQIDKDGAIHLRPKISPKRRKARTLVSFKARESHFDRHNKDSAKNPFRGFLTLFWIGLAITMINTFYQSFASTGQIISLTFATLFSQDAIVLAISDGVLVGSLYLCVPFVKVLVHGWCRYWPTLIWLQHAWQALLLFAVIKWAHYRDWPWVQSGFFVLHTLSMMMKMHSYLAVNGHMADEYFRMKRLEGMIEERVAEVEGSKDEGVTEKAWQRAVETANAAGVAERRVVDNDEAVGASSAMAAPDAAENRQSWDSLPAQRGTNALRQRALPSVIDRRPSHSRLERPKVDEPTTKSKDEHLHVIRDPHPLSTHPDEVISDLAREVEAIREELMSTQAAESRPDVYMDTVTWPSNVTFANFTYYLLVPTLVYELSYPRCRTVRPMYLLEKAAATFGTFFVIYVITEHFIIPKRPDHSTPLIAVFLELAVPMMLNYLLIFYIIFECILMFFAEATRFADKFLYNDFWNSVDMRSFSASWNKVVHNFLLKHVYAPSISAGLSRSGAMFVTFLLSALLHELVMAIVSGKIRGYLFAMQMAQLPMMLISEIKFIKKNETLGNIIFWIGLFIGFPALYVGYLVY